MAKQPKNAAKDTQLDNSSGDGAGREDRTQETTNRIRDRANQIWEAEGRPEGRREEHWLQAEHEILHGMDELGGDDVPNLAALREAAREHTDAFIVKSDLEDSDERDATPGVREQP
ncbi:MULTISPECIES: DUF2934 domain-containing protein [unclassified Rhizobium]|jgi:hypothetical protein|uniref:DUF2934 domain-containing protein n=1 Tax=unclassified Rhizobium TaxID=2613769 RepID=UPI00036F1756|nr:MULTISPECIES: DUF2934 domain-containing protein [unclassified Rhizobium]MBB3447296.1 hypothetical protein [Rhizobium sp. BK379]MBB3565874.1 hypothetical protein [Rhizobium sp. BK512]